jgi:hypothetical protein
LPAPAARRQRPHVRSCGLGSAMRNSGAFVR